MEQQITKKIFRIENPVDMDGMWYTKDGVERIKIHILCPNGRMATALFNDERNYRKQMLQKNTPVIDKVTPIVDKIIEKADNIVEKKRTCIFCKVFYTNKHYR